MDTDVNAPKQDGSTHLLIAALRGQRDIVKSLCGSRTFAHKANQGGMTPLRAACGMTIRAMNTMVKDLLIYRVDNEFVFQNVHPDTAATLHEGRVVAVGEEINFHFLWSL